MAVVATTVRIDASTGGTLVLVPVHAHLHDDMTIAIGRGIMIARGSMKGTTEEGPLRVAMMSAASIPVGTYCSQTTR